MSTSIEQIIADAIKAGVAQAMAELSALPVEAPKAPQPKAEPRYRTAKQNAAGRAKYDALWADLKAKNPGVSARDLAAAHRAELNACYPKGTRKTKA